MKGRFIKSGTLIIVLFCFAFSILIPISVYSQKNTKQLLSANDNVAQAVVTGDSILYFSTLSPDFLIVDGMRGNAMGRDQFWQWWSGRVPEGLKAVGEVTSTKIKGSVAWITYNYTFTQDDNYKEIVNSVKNYEDHEWIATGIFVKSGKKWQCVHWHTSNVAKN